MNVEARHLISKLGLGPLSGEGGFFAPTWTSPVKDPTGRPSGSAILFLITEEDFSALHRLRTDEIWHFHAGDPAEVALLDPGTGLLQTVVLGPAVHESHLPQVTVPAGYWQGARLQPGRSATGRGWALFGCTLAPAWDEREFELGQPESLLREFPAHAGIIRALSR